MQLNVHYMQGKQYFLHDMVLGPNHLLLPVCVLDQKRADSSAKLHFTEVWHYISWLIDTASNGTSSTLNQTFESMWDKTEIDKSTHQWRPEGNERRMFGIRNILHRVGDSVLGVFCQEFFRMKLLYAMFLSWPTRMYACTLK